MMAVKKISISLPEEILDEVARLAEREGLSVSAWLTQAAGHVIRREAGLAAVREWEAEHGEITDDELSAAAAELARADAEMFGDVGKLAG
ncbi:ribbon-helix-helix protein, CopG family [Nonomuraea roseola]|uniref:Ribbon-helix-helix protein, CopG family n=1 Tax=Nonomuraea roseola TaxID=46179 RepID=A0ABV5PQU6_9ACTN